MLPQSSNHSTSIEYPGTSDQVTSHIEVPNHTFNFVPRPAFHQLGVSVPGKVQYVGETGISMAGMKGQSLNERSHSMTTRHRKVCNDSKIRESAGSVYYMPGSVSTVVASKEHHMNQPGVPKSTGRHPYTSSFMLPIGYQQDQSLKGSGALSTVIRNDNAKGSVDEVISPFHYPESMEIIQEGESSLKAFSQAEKLVTDRQVRSQAVPSLRSNITFHQQLQIQRCGSNSIQETKTGHILPSALCRPSHSGLSSFENSHEETRVRDAEESKARLEAQECIPEIVSLDQDRMEISQSMAIASHETRRNLEFRKVPRQTFSHRYDHEMSEGNQKRRAFHFNRNHAPKNALENDRNFHHRPRLQSPPSKSLQTQKLVTREPRIICTPDSDSVQNIVGMMSHKTWVTAERQRNLRPSTVQERNQRILDEILLCSSPEAPLPEDLEREIMNHNENSSRHFSQSNDAPETQNVTQNARVGEDLSPNQDLTENLQMPGSEGLPKPNVLDRNATLRTDAYQNPSQHDIGNNHSDMYSLLLRERAETLHELNLVHASQSDRTNSTVMLNGQHPVTSGTSQKVLPTSCFERKERDPRNHIRDRARRHSTGSQAFCKNGTFDLMNSQTQNITRDTDDLSERSMQLKVKDGGGDVTEFRIANIEHSGTSAIVDVQGDQSCATRAQIEQTAQKSQEEQEAIVIRVSKDAFYNYDWTQLSFADRRNRRKRILKAKRLPPSEVRIKKTAYGDQVTAFGKVPDNAIIELGREYSRKRSSPKKNRRCRNRIKAQSTRDHMKKELEFYVKENRKLCEKLSNCKSSHSVLAKKIEQYQNRVQELEEDTSRLRSENFRLGAEMEILHGFQDRQTAPQQL